MNKYALEAAFGVADITSRQMKQAIRDWQTLYYGSDADGQDPCQRVAYTVVNKIVKTVFGEYKQLSEEGPVKAAVDRVSKEALQQALMAGCCFLKPVMEGGKPKMLVIRRSDVLIFGRDASGQVTDLGCLERSAQGKYYYTLLERRRLDEKGYLVVEYKLFRSLNDQQLGTQVELDTLPCYAGLSPQSRYPWYEGNVGLVCVSTPMVNCVDGSREPVSVYAPAVDLIRRIDRNEAQLCGEFERGQSRLVVSRDLLTDGQLKDAVFVGLDEDPQYVGITAFSPTLREKSYIDRKQEYLRNVESVVGLKRGMLSDSNQKERTATEIAASSGDFNLTVIEFQNMWEQAVVEAVRLWAWLQGDRMTREKARDQVSIDWGNGVLYDEDKVWEQYRQMVADGLLRPEIALGWRFNLPTDTPEQLSRIRKDLMPTETLIEA